MRRNANVQILRGAAASLVFVTHFLIIERKALADPPYLIGDWGWLGLAAVDLFFVISGFIMISVARAKPRGPRNALRFLLDRVGKVYPAYWAFSIPVLALFLIDPTQVNSSMGNQVNIVSSFLLLPQSVLPLLSVGWTLIHEMYFYIVFAILMCVVSEKRTALALWGWALVVVVLNLLDVGAGNPWAGVAFSPLTLDFIAGAFGALAMPHLFRLFGWPLIYLALSVMAVALMQVDVPYEKLFFDPWLRVGCFALPLAMFVVGCALIDTPVRSIGRRFATWIGDCSYSFYLGHLLVLSLALRLWPWFGEAGLIDNVLVFSVCYGICLLVGAVGLMVIERPATSLTRVIGERLKPSAGSNERVEVAPAIEVTAR